MSIRNTRIPLHRVPSELTRRRRQEAVLLYGGAPAHTCLYGGMALANVLLNKVSNAVHPSPGNGDCMSSPFTVLGRDCLYDTDIQFDRAPSNEAAAEF
jgi:hypothetical protein